MTRAQLLALGFTPKAIKHRVAFGRLHFVARGIYAVGRPQLTQDGRWMAAVLACGEGAALCRWSAAELWEIDPRRRRAVNGPVDVVVRRKVGLRRPGIRVRNGATQPSSALTERRNIPVTTPVRTLIELADAATPNQLERAVNEADKRDLVDPDTLRIALRSHAGEPGVKALRTLLDRHTFRLSDDELEVTFRPLAAAAGLPAPRTKAIVNGFEVDFWWPRLGLVVETDGLRYHRTAASQSRDALRDQTHTAAGLTTLRFSHFQVKHEPARVQAVLAGTAARLRA